MWDQRMLRQFEMIGHRGVWAKDGVEAGSVDCVSDRSDKKQCQYPPWREVVPAGTTCNGAMPKSTPARFCPCAGLEKVVFYSLCPARTLAALDVDASFVPGFVRSRPAAPVNQRRWNEDGVSANTVFCRDSRPGASGLQPVDLGHCPRRPTQHPVSKRSITSIKHANVGRPASPARASPCSTALRPCGCRASPAPAQHVT